MMRSPRARYQHGPGPKSSAFPPPRIAMRGMRAGWTAVAAVVALAGAAGAAEPLRYPPNSVLMVVAPWCAPCHGELARIDGIAAAARPRALRVMLAEDGARARAMVRGIDPAWLWDPPAAEMRRARADILERTAGLPFAVATDGGGRICGTAGGGLDEGRLRALVERCRD